MSAQQGNSQAADPSVTIGVGGTTSGEAGSTPTHESMTETGGSGGIQQTQPNDIEAAPYDRSDEDDATASTPEPLGAGSASTATGRGAQDTRSAQAGRLPTGLGTPETGGNQDARDLAPPVK